MKSINYLIAAIALASITATPAAALTTNDHSTTTNNYGDTINHGGTGIGVGVGIGVGGQGGNAESSSSSSASSASKSASASASSSNSGGNTQSITIKSPAPLPVVAAPVATAELHDLTANRPGGISTAEYEMGLTFSPDISERIERDGVVLTVTASSEIKAHERKTDNDPGCAVGFRLVEPSRAIGYITAQPVKRGNTVSVSAIRAAVKRYLDDRYAGVSAMTSAGMLGVSVGVDGGGRGGSIAPAIGSFLRDMSMGAGIGIGAQSTTARPDAQISVGFALVAE